MKLFIEAAQDLGAPVVEKETKSGKVFAKVCLQEADTPNSNRRIYSMALLAGGMADLGDMVAKRGFVGELDHPVDSDMGRQTTVLYKECSHIITKYWWEGKLLCGLLETTSNRWGMDLAKLIAADRIPVGFSLRAIGDTRKVGGGYEEVVGPLKVFCYDCVQRPSNKRAVVMEILREQYEAMAKARPLAEAEVAGCPGGRCMLPGFQDAVVARALASLNKFKL